MFSDFMVVQECIEKYLRLGHNECPKCRVKVSSRRALRQDQLFDGLISALYPDINRFQAHEDELISRVNLESHAQTHSIIIGTWPYTIRNRCCRTRPFTRKRNISILPQIIMISVTIRLCVLASPISESR